MIDLNYLIGPADSRMHDALVPVYGSDEQTLALNAGRFSDLARRFQDYFPGHDKVRLFSTPGRTEISGNHTDHQHGRVLCAAVGLDIIAVVAPSDDGIIELKSRGFSRMDRVNLALLDPQEDEVGHSSALIRGVAASIKDLGGNIGGFTAYTSSDVPAGSGLSSSAAFEVLVGTILNELYNEGRFSMVELARAGQKAENLFFGKPSGLMDQCGCAVGGFIAIDFQNKEKPEVRHLDVDFSQAGYRMVITKTGGTHADLTDDYAAIPREMGAVAGDFGAEVLRDVSEADFWPRIAELRTRHGDRAVMRSMHFFHENERALRAGEALSSGDFDLFLETVRASGLSSWTLLQNVTSSQSLTEQPVAMALALSQELLKHRGVSRVHGGGFAGTIQAFVHTDDLEAYTELMGSVFGPDNVMPVDIRQAPSCEIKLA